MVRLIIDTGTQSFVSYIEVFLMCFVTAPKVLLVLVVVATFQKAILVLIGAFLLGC